MKPPHRSTGATMTDLDRYLTEEVVEKAAQKYQWGES